MPGLHSEIDPDGLLEYSVVYTDRALNHMSLSFRQIINEISATLKSVYHAAGVVIVPGGGTFAMEAVARQFASGKNCLVIRNGWFSYRWSQIFEMGNIPSHEDVLMAQQVTDETTAPFQPQPIEDVVSKIESSKPDIVFAPHVETSAGMVLPDDYIRSMADAVHAAGGLLVLDCIASGTDWINMDELGVDVLISAPQKGWSSSPCAGLVMLSERALTQLESTTSSSFAGDLKQWHKIMSAFESGGHAYHATMPTDGLAKFHSIMQEMQSIGWEELDRRQAELGGQIRQVLVDAGFPSVAADGFQASGVVVSYTDNPEIKSGKKFAEAGIQIAGGVPLQVGERDDFQTFRIGLFGIDKLKDVDRTVQSFQQAVAAVTAQDSDG